MIAKRILFIPIMKPFLAGIFWLGFLGTLQAQTHFRYTSNTGNNATVAVPLTANPNINGTPLASGDEIGAFTPAGLCVGAAVWNSASNAITVWGDDDQTTEIDGIEVGEQILYRVWRELTNTEYASVSVTYSQGNGLYSINGLYALSSLNATAPPDAPTLLSPADAATEVPTSPTFSWNPSSFASNYRLQVSPDVSFSTQTIDINNISETSYTGSGLAGSTLYYWRVRASNSGGSSDFSSAWTFTTIEPPPPAPSLSAPSNGSVDQPVTLTVSWGSVTGAQSYRLQVATEGTFSSPIIDQASLVETSFQISALSNSTTYYWRVNTSGAGGTGDWSTIWSFTTVPAPPPAPVLSSPADGATDQLLNLTLNWNAASGASSYRLQVSTSPGFEALLVDKTALTTISDQVSGLTANTTYYWRVNATNSGGTGGWSTTWSFLTIPDPPATPSLVSPADGTTDQPTSINLTWDAASGAASYRLQVSTSPSFASLLVNDSTITTTSQQVGPLTNSTTYYWRVRAKNSGGLSNWTGIWAFTTIVAPPAAPTLSSPSDGATDQPTTVILMWNGAARASTYHMQVSTAPTFENTVVNDSTISGTSRQVTALQNNTAYYWRVRAKNAGGTSSWSDSWSFTTTSGLPAPPTAPTLSSPPDGVTNQALPVTLSWNASSGASNYHVQLSTGSSFTTTVLDDSTITATSRQVDTLSATTTYYWRARARNDGGVSPWSAAWKFTTAVPLPPAPTLINPVTGVTDQPTNVALKWNSVPSASAYHVQVSTSATFSTMTYENSALQDTTRVPTGLENSTTYRWRVRAQNTGGVGQWSEVWDFTTVPVVPPAPVLVSPPSGDTTQSRNPALSWFKTDRATSYRLQMSTIASFNDVLLVDSTLSDTTFTASGLSASTTYHWRVFASNSGGQSASSSAWTFKTTPDPPAAPILASPEDNASNQPTAFDIRWNASSGATSYAVQVSTSATFSSTVINQNGITATSYSISGLEYNTLYYWRVSASNSGGTSAWSSVRRFTTQSGDPLAPTLSAPANSAAGIATNPTLQWNASSGAMSYGLQVSTTTDFSSTIVNEQAITATSKAVSGLSKGTTYYWRVNAQNALGTSGWSSIWGFTTIVDPPPAPALFSPADNATGVPTSPTLIWTSAQRATAYRVQVSTSQDFASPLIDQKDVGSTSLAVSGLSDATVYYWRVNGSNSGGEGAWSSIWRFETISATPSVVVLTLPANGARDLSTIIDLRWNPVSGATSYRVEVSHSADFSALVVDSAVTPTVLRVGPLASGTVYFWRVTASNNGGQSPPSGAWTFSTVDPTETEPISVSVDFPATNQPKATDYRLVGLPGASGIRADAILKGKSGEDWRLFWDNGAATDYLAEFDGTSDFSFTVGRAFWLIHDGPINALTNIPAAPLNSSQEAEIPLHARWNLITNPFMFAVEWSAVKSLNGVTTPIYRFAGAFSAEDTLRPFEGYYFDNMTGLSVLKIPRISSTQAAPSTAMGDMQGWTLRISLTVGSIIDNAAWLGTSQHASRDQDMLDMHKPRALGDVPGTRFDRPQWDARYSSFASDIRPRSATGDTWEFDVSCTAGVPSLLSFSGILEIPSDQHVYLLDLQRAKAVNLRTESNYAFTSFSGASSFEIVVGIEEFVQNAMNKLQLPGDMHLGNNFPNPFNPSTTIFVSVPSQAEVTLMIYNLLGQRVRLLHSGVLNRGRHYFLWDGEDDQRQPVSSGTYFFRLTSADGKNLVHKATLVR